MRTNLIAALGLAGVLASTSCATKSGTGTAVGATGGGLIGLAAGGTTGALVGAAVGGLLGYTAGRAMEEEDRRRVAYAMEADREARWRNPDTGYYYDVEPQRTVMSQGRQCREFRMIADTGNGPEEIFGTACRRRDGTWEIVSG